MTTATLATILDYKKQELEHTRRRVSVKDVAMKARDVAPPRDFLRHFGDGINIIAEMKKASPSAGLLCADYAPATLASAYADNGAKALSVVTDEKFFQGSLTHIAAVRALMDKRGAQALPILRKDFTLDEYHIFEARSAGADAVLLIVSALDAIQLKDYFELARELGMNGLVEAHEKQDICAALDIGATLIGINNRNLTTLQTDIAVTLKLLPYLLDNLKYLDPAGNNSARADSRAERPGRVAGKVPPQSPSGAGTSGQVTVISESGISRPDTLSKLKEKGVSGFLIGEALLKAKDPGAKLREMAGGMKPVFPGWDVKVA